MKLPFVCVALCALSTLAAAQDPPFRASLRSSHFRSGVTYADVWAEGTTALAAHIGANEVDIIDVSDPDDATFLTTWVVPPPNGSASAQDVKGANGLAFIALESGGSDSVQIVDVRTPATPALLSNVNIVGFINVHNLFVDGDWLYICNGATDGIGIIDLRGYDPDNPPAQITTAKWGMSGLGTVHDVTVENGLLWISDISGTQKVFDASNVANAKPTFLGEIKGGAVHSNWPTADQAYVTTADESLGGPIKLFEVVDSGSSIQLVQRDSWVNTLSGVGEAGNPHNPVVFENRVYVANNQGGVLCLQIDRTSNTCEKVASYDTSTITPTAASGQGCWGVYPFLGHDSILATDRQTGFYVLDFSALEIAFTAARPLTLLAGGPCATIDVTIDELGSISLDPATVTLRYRIDGGAFQTTAMTNTSGNVWRAAFPMLQCGEKLEYYVVADDTLGQRFTRPGEAPEQLYTAFGASGLTTVFSDDFETDKGWTTQIFGENFGGFWERGEPVDNGYQPPFGDPDSAGNQCYVTEIGTGGADDVDGGEVVLVSPVMDFSGGDGMIHYRRWFFTDDADGPQSNPFVVQVTNDGSAWTTVETVRLSAGGWRHHAFRISDYVTPTSQVQVRFFTSDTPNNSTIEAGVDTFVAQRFECVAASAVSRNGTGLNAVCYTALAPPVLGATFQGEVSHAGHPGASFTAILFYPLPATGPINKYGELLVDVGSGKFLQSLLPSSGTEDVHSLPVPCDPSLAGAMGSTQAVILGGAGPELCNAVDLKLGI